MPAKNPPVQVEIYGQSYPIGGVSDPAYVHRLAEQVDAKMRQVARETRVVDTVRVAVLAAINLADENAALRARAEELERSTQAKARALERRLDRALGGRG